MEGGQMEKMIIAALTLAMLTSCTLAMAEDGEDGLPYAGGDYEQPKNLYYLVPMNYDQGKMSLEDDVTLGSMEYEKIEDQLEYGYTCKNAGGERTRSKYSENVPTKVCFNPDDESYLENTDSGYSECRSKYSSSRDKEFFFEVVDFKGEALESFDFTFTIETTCFACEEPPEDIDESSLKPEGTASKCVANDEFPFTLIVPYHEKAEKINVYEMGKDEKKKRIRSIDISEFKETENRIVPY